MGDFLFVAIAILLIFFPLPFVLYSWWRFWLESAEDTDRTRAAQMASKRGVHSVPQPEWDPKFGARPKTFLQDIETIRQLTLIYGDDSLILKTYVKAGCEVKAAVSLLGGERDPVSDLRRIRAETGVDLESARDAYEKSGWRVDLAVKLLGTLQSRVITERLREIDQLRNDGQLSDEEHAVLRRRILDI